MGELEHEKIALDCVNLFQSAIDGDPNLGESAPCFRTLNYRPIFSPRFQIPVIEDGYEIERSVNPDFLLWNSQKRLALLIEVKGENSIEDRHLNQLEKYQQISNEKIEKYIQDALDIPPIQIIESHIGIVYKSETIERCNNSQECIQRLNKIKANYLVLKQEHGGQLQAINQSFINFDDSLRELLIEGIELPQNPKKIYYLLETPCLKGVIWGLIEYLIDIFFSGERIESKTLNPGFLQNIAFPYSNAPRSHYDYALKFLSDSGYCTTENNEFTFNFRIIEKMARNHEVLIERINTLNCSRPKPTQKKLSEFT